jgi:pimeloyl-ACP methyl ester carboxylesterase
LDILVLIDLLKIEKGILAGYDLGSRSADIIAALWPQQVKTLVSVTGHLIANLAAGQNRTTVGGSFRGLLSRPDLGL